MELRLILGDQLNAGHSWFRTPDPAVCYLMAELRQETDYCRHHRQKEKHQKKHRKEKD